MRAHLDALRAALSSVAAGGVHVAYAHDAALPYIVLSSPRWGVSGELPVCGADGALDVEFRVKAVAGTGDGVYAVLAKAQAVLSPGLLGSPLTVPGRFASTKFVRSESVAADTSTTVTSTDRHPVQGVDTYRLHSQPA